ncbi:cyclin-dependent kinase F-4-like protein isoform X1, partial [Tanacetum coccineum]
VLVRYMVIADFGLAREITSEPTYTKFVSTRWYQAPEVLIQFPKYGHAVDLWAMGAIMAGLFTLRPLFPGSSKADEIYKICSVIGSLTEFTRREGLERSSKIIYQFPEGFPPACVKGRVPLPSGLDPTWLCGLAKPSGLGAM